MDENTIDEMLWRMADLLGEHYNPDDFWGWLEETRSEHYDRGYRHGRADALGAI